MRRKTLITAALLLAAVSSPSAAIADGDTPYMATIAIERAAGSSTALGTSLVSVLHVREPERTAASLSLIDGVDVTATDDSTVSIRFDARPTLNEDPDARHRESSWVVDFSEDSIQALVTQLAKSAAEDPTPAQLEHFVFEHIANKSYSRSFDLASRVAATGEGDCTEHAVLLAALARAHGFPARVVLGNLILDLDEGLFAFGHAWTEIHTDDDWQIFDATQPDHGLSWQQIRYIPLGSLGNEGPGYFMSMVEIMSTLPTRISGVGNSP